MAGHVYLIGSKRFGWFKIGKSSDAKIRVTQLGVLLPFHIEVLAIWRAENHHELEHILHEKYAMHRINGEWFGFSKKQLRSLIEEMKMAAVSMLANFSNIIEHRDDWNRKKKTQKTGKPYYSPEEREARKQKAMAERAAKKSLTGK